MAFFLKNERTEHFARHDSDGEHDQRTTPDINLAACFETRGAASAFAQNFGPDWQIEEWG